MVTVLISLNMGAFQVDLKSLMGQSSTEFLASSQYFILMDIRLPRIVLAGLTGAGLAITGAAIQGMFRNPLADPSLIGVTSGAMLFAVMSIVLMGVILPSMTAFFQQSMVALFAFAGSMVSIYLVYFLSKKAGRTHIMTMLLAGIAITALTSAISGIFIYLSDEQQLRDITFWSLGSFGGATWTQVFIAGPIILIGIYKLNTYCHSLNAIMLGEHEAEYLGVAVEKVKTGVILISSLIVGVCIAMSGIIGFVGLVIPHFIRLIKGADYRFLMKSSALTGAIFMILTDDLARTIIAPAELPIGILSALVGGPFFLWLLMRSQKEQWLL
ncbi:iron ABC transporter permease [Membranihabitans marinus]